DRRRGHRRRVIAIPDLTDGVVAPAIADAGVVDGARGRIASRYRRDRRRSTGQGQDVGLLRRRVGAGGVAVPQLSGIVLTPAIEVAGLTNHGDAARIVVARAE